MSGAVLATLAGACGGSGPSTIKPAQAAKYVTDLVFSQTGFRAVDVSCPPAVPAQPGRLFQCHFTGPEGPYAAYLKVVAVNGGDAAFTGKTQPSAWPVPTGF
ncbi:MAG: DUF4333 domain-containing protein [Acidimicrobiales bacterium]